MKKRYIYWPLFMQSLYLLPNCVIPKEYIAVKDLDTNTFCMDIMFNQSYIININKLGVVASVS